MNRTQRRVMAKIIIKGQVNPKIRLRYTTKLEEFKQHTLAYLEGTEHTKLSKTDRLALQDAIKFKTEENDNSGDSTTSDN